MSLFSPDLYHTSVLAIDLEALSARGVRYLLMDLDNTLLPRDGSGIAPEVQAWVSALPDHGFTACLVSNNWHGHVQGVAADIGLPIAAKALKPLPHAFRTGLARLNAAPAETAVVGDQLFTDVLGGNLLGMTTILVRPLSASDLPHTLLLRHLERRLLAGREPLA